MELADANGLGSFWSLLLWYSLRWVFLCSLCHWHGAGTEVTMPDSSRREPSLLSLTMFFCLSILMLLPSRGPRLRAETEPRYEIIVSKNVMVAMRDGVNLATDIYRPGETASQWRGSFRFSWKRTPYNKDGGGSHFRRYPLLRRITLSPADMSSCCRTFADAIKSEGHWRPIQDDPNDGFDTANGSAHNRGQTGHRHDGHSL